MEIGACLIGAVDQCLSERSVLDWNDRSSWVSLDRSSWVWVLPDRCLWIGAVEIGACLIGAVEIGACDRDGVD